ncbi:Transposon Tf2-11 polyprotein [Zancudomyces culisetae]|uniref:RNA-directed DNA polymerase n=1 Tax=Zancudomyces culisetae TaxID=1213189 RepID=A0A1R1PHA4_ZANCU|nr:Transposon Tf2-11 polyprotein [Zancudomyces culisetae]|eukprot:OMH80354.1 Transposon Tf2-11 polyprotein [Zancudomyces culisetae]
MTITTPKTFEVNKGIDPEEWIEDFKLIAKLNGWNDFDLIDLVKLFLGSREKIWYKKNRTTFNTWDELAKKFKEKFSTKSSKGKVWERLRSIKQTEFGNVDEFEVELVQLLDQAKIKDEEIRFDILLSTLKRETKEKVESLDIKKWERVMELLLNEEGSTESIPRKQELREKSSGPSKEYNANAASRGKSVKDLAKQQIPMGDMLKKFEEMSVSLITKVEQLVDKRLKEATVSSHRPQPYVVRCYYCNEQGHRRYECPKMKESEPRDSGKVDIQKSINYIELDRNTDTDENNADVFAVDKRKHNEVAGGSSEQRASRYKTTRVSRDSFQGAEPSIIGSSVTEFREGTTINDGGTAHSKQSSRSQQTLKNSNKTFSIVEELRKVHPKIDVLQLLESAPALSEELTNFLRKEKVAELNEIQLQEKKTSNCRIIVNVFGQKLWAVVDTGAACSVVTYNLVEGWGIELDSKKGLTLVTADGKRHSTLGKVNQVPVMISSFTLPVNLVVMSRNDDTLILGTDWLLQHRVSLNLKVPELRIPVENVEIVTRLETSCEEGPEEEDTELYTVIKDTPVGVGTSQGTEFKDVISEYKSLFVNDLSELTQTGVTEHRIVLNDNMPIRLRPYRILFRLQEEVANQLVTQPLTKLLRKQSVWSWDTEQEAALRQLKELMASAPVLGHADWTREFVITTDASIVGIGAVLTQFTDEGKKVMEYASRRTTKSEKNYAISHLEGLAVIWAVKKFKFYVYGKKFRIRTDHKSLLQLFHGSEITGRVARWAMYLRTLTTK